MIRARYARIVIHSIFVLGPSALGMGKVTSNNLNLRNLRYNEKFFHVMLPLINRNLFQLHPITPVKLLKPRLWIIWKFVYYLVVNNKYSSLVVDIIKFGISVPDYPSSNVETTLLGQFCICLNFSRKQRTFIICC